MTACLDIFDVNICVYNFPSTLSNILIEDKLCFSYTQVQPTIADDGLKSVGTRISGMTPQATQTCSPSLTDVGTETLMPELVIENINHSNELIMFYTGLPDSKPFHALF